MNSVTYLIFSGVLGLVASIFVGWGEFLLHYSKKGHKNSSTYQYMKGISQHRFAAGHFLAVLSCPLYLVGYWHIYKMLEPSNAFLSLMTVVVGGYGIVIGAVWIGSRALIGAIVQNPKETSLIRPYQFYYETLLYVVRFTTAFMSLGYIYLIWQGGTLYPTWMIFVNPLFLLVIIFIIYFLIPSLGKYIVPMAMNVAYGIFFIFSTFSLYFQGYAS